MKLPIPSRFDLVAKASSGRTDMTPVEYFVWLWGPADAGDQQKRFRRDFKKAVESLMPKAKKKRSLTIRYLYLTKGKVRVVGSYCGERIYQTCSDMMAASQYAESLRLRFRRGK